MNNNVTIHNEGNNKIDYDYSRFEALLNKKCNKLNDSIDDASEELSDRFDDKFNNLQSKVAGLSGSIDSLVSKAEQLENGSIPITLDIPSKSRKPFVNLDDDSEENDGHDEIGGSSSSDFGGVGNMEEIPGDDEDSEDSDYETDDDLGSNLATKADMQKLADYIKEETERSRPTIPKEAGIAIGLVGVGIILKRYAMILGGRYDVFR